MKRLVLCCDGTWSGADQEFDDGTPGATNVLKLADRVAKHGHDGTLQIVYYDQGVGTGNWVDRLTGGAFGVGLAANLYEAYRFLIANYEYGDQIFLFGFSRGAYTVRSIAGMILKCGILRRTSVHCYKQAIELYQSTRVRSGDEPARQFRARHSVSGEQSIPLQMIGVWDTVGALGIPIGDLRFLTPKRYLFHDVELSAAVRWAYQALAVDEHRGPFEPTLWADIAKPNQTIEQVWFAGSHSDVGGGFADHALSDISLEWMIDKASASPEPGLVFDEDVIHEFPYTSDARGQIHDSVRGAYLLVPRYQRIIGLAAMNDRDLASPAARLDATQSLHPSLVARWDADTSYRPAGLREYFTRMGDPRGLVERT